MNQLPLRISLLSKLFRLLPSRTPLKTRLASLLLKNSLREEDIMINDKNGCFYKVPSLREPIAFHTLINGIYEPPLANLLCNRLTCGNTFVDVGANIGVITIPVAKKIGDRGHVVAIEASPSIFQYLEHNVTLNRLSNITLHNCAAFHNDSDNLPFYEAPVEKFGMGSLSAQFNSKPIATQARTLDNILTEQGIQHVDFLKVDVEGFEAAVFRGARCLLTSSKSPVIIFEFCDWAEDRVTGQIKGDAQRILMEWGYSIWRLSDFSLNKSPLRNIITNGCDILVANKGTN